MQHQPDSTDICDPASGLPRVLSEQCSTCVFRPGNLMHLAPGRLKEMVEENVARGSWITCHQTLPYYPEQPGWQAICKGFADAPAAQHSLGLRLARALGGPVEVSLAELPAEGS